MKNQDQVILREIQKNTHMGLEAIDALMPRVRDEHFARELAKESMMYGNYYEKATNELLKEEREKAIYCDKKIPEDVDMDHMRYVAKECRALAEQLSASLANNPENCNILGTISNDPDCPSEVRELADSIVKMGIGVKNSTKGK